MNADSDVLVRKALRNLTTAELLRGMRAFAHPPRGQSYPAVEFGDRAGCFCCEAFSPRDPIAWRVVPNDRIYAEREALSMAYETHGCGGDNTAFRLECIRELAERGVVPESAWEVQPVAVPGLRRPERPMTDLETQVAAALERLRVETWIEGPPGQTLIEWLRQQIAPRVALAIRTAAVEESEDVGLAALWGTPDP